MMNPEEELKAPWAFFSGVIGRFLLNLLYHLVATRGHLVSQKKFYSFRSILFFFCCNLEDYLNSNCVKHLALFSLLLRIDVASATVVEQLVTKLL